MRTTAEGVLAANVLLDNILPKKIAHLSKDLPLPCSTGWLSHWGEVMANTSAQFVLQTLSDILSYKNGTGSVNFYMAHGGSNFGYWAGADSFCADRERCSQFALL